MPNGRMTRRQFLIGTALTSLTLAACGTESEPQPTSTPTAAPTPTETPPPPTPTPQPLSFFDALEALRRAVRASPDHRVARAEALVAARDAEGIVRFVREAIAVYPSAEYGIGDTTKGWRWGTRATLRGGAGTPREVAELLAELLQRAGVQAQVVISSAGSLVTAAEVIRRARSQPFAPALEEPLLSEVRRALNLPQPQPVPSADPEGRESAALARPILEALGSQARAPLPFNARERVFSLPNVQVTLNGQVYLANLWSADQAAFLPAGQSYLSAGQPQPSLSVTIRVEAAHSHAPSERFTLVEGTWRAEDLVGRQVEIAFVPPVRTLSEVLAYRRTSTRAQQLLLTPALVVYGPDLDTASVQKLSVLGQPFTLSGQVLQERGGRAAFGDRALPARGEKAPIGALEASLNAAAFPYIIVEIAPRDRKGEVIENLSADHFIIEEDGKPMTALMEQWARPAPRVLILLDDSGSIPADFRAQKAQVLVRELAARIKAARPDAQFRVAKIFDERADAGYNKWTPDPGALPAQAQSVTGAGSRLWESLADAARHNPTVIVMITDGQAIDASGQRITEPPPALLAAVRTGPPAVVIGVGEIDPAMLEKLGAAGRLGAFPASTQEEAITAAVKALEADPTPPYRFTYRAPEAGGEQRTVTIRVLSPSAPSSYVEQARLSYTVPPKNARAAFPTLSGLFLTITVGLRSVTRVLGGLFTANRNDAPTPQHLDAVRRALSSRTTLSFEAGAPTLSQVLDDCYTAMLSLRPILEARDLAGRLNAMASNPLYLPPSDLHLGSIPLPDNPAEPMTFEHGLRVTLHRALPVQSSTGEDAAARWVDLLPLASFRTADGDAERAFRLTAQRTARLALAEALGFPSSTVTALKGKALQLARYDADILRLLKEAGAPEGVHRSVIATFAPWLREGHLTLVPSDGTLAGWAIDRHGAIWGVLGGNGVATAGGGSTLSPIIILDGALLVSDLLAMSGLGGFSFAGGVWLALAAKLHEKLEAATAVIAQLPVSADDPTPRSTQDAEKAADFSDLGCTLAQAVAFEVVSRVGSAFLGEGFARAVSAVSAADGAKSMITGKGLFCE
ncbi:MAG: VWA domain-containing protein [Thermoflexales bacterium]|nr:VWA domain-containing protein [Thermoflexales bacterium]